ncbi:hypothetical protein PtA15_7A264 [Puccinia triticina]|uniref:SCD domain-containing protein n=1 Tax=Puccinia triticina TaxID=208348 RepID=A0ABY7CNN1_9BASI|nr:uncharacterized protein PtA15_7A264 [Puccinia triticina]WAQ86538.1 hypothetical protein PtA15_7A264 [Puccinia triticina]
MSSTKKRVSTRRKPTSSAQPASKEKLNAPKALPPAIKEKVEKRKKKSGRRTSIDADSSDHNESTSDHDHPNHNEESGLSDHHSASSNEDQDFTPKSTAKATKPRPSTSKDPKQNAQVEQDGNETNQDNPGRAAMPQAEYEINQDNDLFNTIRMGASAIQPTLEDWIEVYQGSGEDDEDAKGQAISQLINFILRCCGCNCSIDKHKALDIDAVTETLDTIQENFKKVPSQAYPLIVKSGKSFRHTSTVISLFGFVSPMCEILVSARKELTSLSRKVEVEAAKKHAGSSKLEQLAEWQKRKKHVLQEKTALENFISEFFDGVFVHRYRDADPNIRVDCIQALGQWMAMVPDYFLEGNYLRYIGWVLTDSHKDARNEALRALCTLYSKEENIGVMQHFTSRFRPRLIEMATGESDFTTRCLSINIVTQIDRHGLLDSRQRKQLGRLIYHEDSRVRKAASAFFANMFEEAFEARKTRLDAVTQSPSKSRNPKQKSRAAELETQIAFKCLAHLLIKLERESKSDTAAGGDGQSSSSEDEFDHDEDDPQIAGQHSGSLYQNDLEKGRIDFAIEDLWPRVEVLHDWQALCQYLLLDHTTSTNRPQASSKPVQPGRSSVSLANTDNDDSADEGSQQDPDTNLGVIDDACQLSEAEENILVEVFVASLRKFGSTLTAAETMKMRKRKKKRLHPEATDEEGEPTEDEATVSRRLQESTEDEPENKAELTRVMISLLPKLWSKFMTDPVKLAEVFRIPKLMSLNIYLDLRMVSAFEKLWDTMIKQYLKQQHLGTIQVISSTIAHVLSESKSLEHVSQAKIVKLHGALLSSLKDLTANRSDIEKDQLREDEIVSLTLLLTKIARLFRQSDMSSSIKSTDSDTTGSTSPYELINALAKRAHLAHPTEVKLVEVAMEILQLNFTWTSASIYRLTLANETSIGADPPPGPEAGGTSALSAKLEYGVMARDNLVNLLAEYAISPNSRVNRSIKRAAFIHLLNTYLLCQGTLIPEDLRLRCTDETQAKCASFIELEIQNFIDEKKDEKNQIEEYNDDGENHVDRDDAGTSRNSKKSKTNPPLKPKLASLADPTKLKVLSVEELHRIEEFDLLITTFAKSIRCGLIHFQHSVVIIQHFTRFTKIFDISVELLVAALNDSVSNTPDQIGVVITCLTDVFKVSFELYLGSDDYTEEQFIRLCRLLQSVLILRGPRMSYKARFDSSSAAKLHLDCIQWLIGKATDPEPEPPLMNKLGAMFRGLALLLIGIDGRSCLQIKAETERLIEERELSIPTSKSWDPYQLYMKRLISAMAKDPNIKRAARLALEKRSANIDPAGEDGAVNGTSRRQLAVNDDGDEAEMGPPKAVTGKTKRKSQPRPRPKKLKAKAREESSESSDERAPQITRGKGRAEKSAERPRRLRSRSPVSSRVPSSAVSRNRRESSVVSVVIPMISKRKRLLSEHRPQPSESGSTPGGSSHKRMRLSAVVIEKMPDQERRKSRNQGVHSSHEPSLPLSSSSRAPLESLPSGRSFRPSSPLDRLPASDHQPRNSTPRDSTPRPPNSSPSGSEMSLAAVKRQSRRQLQK